jgi:hypothetical protein
MFTVTEEGQAVTLLSCITEVVGSNLGWATNYSEVLSVLRLSPKVNSGLVRLIRPRSLHSTSFAIYYSLMIRLLNAV